MGCGNKKATKNRAAILPQIRRKYTVARVYVPLFCRPKVEHISGLPHFEPLLGQFNEVAFVKWEQPSFERIGGLGRAERLSVDQCKNKFPGSSFARKSEVKTKKKLVTVLFFPQDANVNGAGSVGRTGRVVTRITSGK